MRLPITYLFVPGDRPDRFSKALATGADVIVLDLEDAVAPSEKAQARENVRTFVDAHPESRDRIVVRIGDAGSTEFRADLDLLHGGGVRFVMLPKAENSQAVGAVCRALPSDAWVLPLIETALGIHNLDSIANSPQVQRLVFGTLDYGVDLDLSGDERGLVYPSARIALASRCAGIASPVAGVTSTIDDDARLLFDLTFARALGFGAKLCIHPRQVAAVTKAFRPSPAEVEWARKVVTAAEGCMGAVQVDGRMVDRPVVLKAQALLARAARGEA